MRADYAPRDWGRRRGAWVSTVLCLLSAFAMMYVLLVLAARAV